MTPAPIRVSLRTALALLLPAALAASPAFSQGIDPQKILASAARAQANPDDAGGQAIVRAPRPGWATPSAPLDVPQDAQGLVFFRKQDTLVHLTSDGQRSFQSQLVRLLQPQALQIGNVAIAWNPAAGEAQIHALRIHRGDRVIDVLEKNSFEVLRREDQLEQAMLTGMLTATLRVPDLRVGDDLELEYSVPLHDPILRGTSHGLLLLGDSPPQGRFRLELLWAEDKQPTTRITPDFEKLVARGSNSLAITLDNPDTALPPRGAPPRYGWTRIIEFSDFADWQSVSRRFHTLFDEARAIGANSPLREEAALIAAENGSKSAQMQAALKLVQQQVRYVYVGLNGGNYRPASADETWERRYGDCKGKTAMLLALLDELGIEAEAVLVNNSLATDGLDERLPNPAFFDHVLVRATIDGKSYWLDGTMPPVVEGRERPFLNYRWALPLSEAGAVLERQPDQPFDLPQAMSILEIDARAGFDKPARKVNTIVTRGVDGLQQHMAFTSITSQQLETALRSELAGGAQWSTIESAQYRFDEATQAGILTLTGTGPVDWDDEDDGGFSLTLPGGGFSPPPPRQRSGSAQQDAPYFQDWNYTCYVTSVRLPDDTALEDWEHNSTFDVMMFGEAFYRAMERREDRTIRMVRGNRVEQTEISAARAARDNERLDRFDNSMAVVTYTPGAGYGAELSGNKDVPAAWEIDWSASDAPCLPPDMLAR
jgi:hypothetical protein